jgi:D-serine deaminase-like pyridoxal phosphate-dependent protein
MPPILLLQFIISRRAGLTPESSNLESLIVEVITSPFLTLHGFYSHAGNSYASKDADTAADFLRIEVEAVEKAASLAHTLVEKQGLAPLNLVLSVGSTPTAHASTLLSQSTPGSKLAASGGALEIHAGVYPLCDLQQHATGLAPEENLALGVLARACSVYTDRPTPQVLIDAGAIAFSKDTGPSGDFGVVYGDGPLQGWRLAKISQVSISFGA